MLTTPALEQHVTALRARLSGDFVTPDDPNWDEARVAWNLAVDQRPAAVALVEGAGDVVAVVEFARDHDLRVAPQGTGHNASAIRTLDDTILLKTERMRGVEVDPVARVARVEAGVTWGEVTGPVSEHGLTALAGSSHDVGVVGYTLGGGMSFLARSHGLAASSVTAAEIVTADGRFRRVDEDNDPDLFWALRGGGGSFGVVTALEFRLYDIQHVYAGMFLYPWERSTEVLQAWRELVPSLPDEMLTLGRIIQFPPLPDLPDFLRGRQVVVVEAVFTGAEAEGAELLGPLRDLGPEIDTVATIPTPALQQLHMDPPQPVPGASDHLMLGELDAAAIDALVAVAGPGSGSPILSVELRQLGGALAEEATDRGACSAFPGAHYAMFAVGITPDAAAMAAVTGYLPRLREALAPYDVRSEYLNFAEAPTDTSSMFTGDAYSRLCAIRTAYDPEDRFRSNHPIPAAS